MRYLLAFILCLAADAVHADVDVFTVSADQWALQRSGAALVRLEPVREAVADWLGDKDARIVIQHAASDTGNLWADELQDWLVALGVPADHIGKRASADQPDDAVALKVEH
ncbi:MAG TPA: hypothetical protein VF651_12440 [Gammaproteobacteria bacterium]